MIQSLAGALTLISTAPAALAAEHSPRRRLGLDMYSCSMQRKLAREKNAKARFSDALGFLEYAHELAAGGVQVALGSEDLDFAKKFRSRTEAYEMYFEGQVSLPKTETDLPRFKLELTLCKEAGASIVRTAMLGGRRYETFDTAESFRQFAEQSWRSLALAEPMLRRHHMRLAIENHKDWLIEELVSMLKRISSEYVGVCVDTGNSIALLEQPMEVVDAYAPWAISTHLKDMGVEEYAEGFLLSEVPLGRGFLNLQEIVGKLLRANPKLHFNLEMITRDPLRIPCLSAKYWATLGTMPAHQLARMLAMVRAPSAQGPLPRVSDLALDEQLKREDENVRQSFTWAQSNLGL